MLQKEKRLQTASSIMQDTCLIATISLHIKDTFTITLLTSGFKNHSIVVGSGEDTKTARFET